MSRQQRTTKKGKPKGKGAMVPIDDDSVSGRVKFPNKKAGEMFGRVVEIFGADRMDVFCEDGKHRLGRIRGKIKKRVWIRKGDLVVVNPWGFETKTTDKLEHCEITWRYMKNEVSWLTRNKKIPEVLDINNIPF